MKIHLIFHYHDLKSTNMVWTSKPFYSNPRFYIKIYPGGHGEGLGTHLSFFVHTVTEVNGLIDCKGRIKVSFRTTRNIKDLEYTLDFEGSETGVDRFLSNSEI